MEIPSEPLGGDELAEALRDDVADGGWHYRNMLAAADRLELLESEVARLRDAILTFSNAWESFDADWYNTGPAIEALRASLNLID